MSFLSPISSSRKAILTTPIAFGTRHSSYPTSSLAIPRVPYSGMAASNPTFAAAALPGLFRSFAWCANRPRPPAKAHRQTIPAAFLDGKRNTNYDGVCTNAEVRPETTYRFSAWVRTQALTSDEGVRFRLSWFSPSRASGFTDSQDSRGTQPWTPVEMPWTSGKDVRRARVCVLRNPSRGLDARIQGTAWDRRHLARARRNPPPMKLLQIGLCAVLVFAIVAHGAVEDWARAVLETSAGLLFLFWAARAYLTREDSVFISPLLPPLLALIFLALGQFLFRAPLLPTTPVSTSSS